MTDSAQPTARRVKRLGREVGFDLVRIAAADDLVEERRHYRAWVAEGRQGDMQWITPERVQRSTSPSTILPGARSIICVGMSYWAGHRPVSPGSGKIARYAWGADYHSVVGRALRELAANLERELGGRHRPYVDTGPLMDKALAARAGLGWYGKSSNILTEPFGSFVVLGEIVSTLEFEPDRPLRRDCGACRACVVACPTAAIGPDHSIDSRKCISYLTIEHRGPIPLELRALMGDWVFGCDICQDVCPPTMMPHLQSSDERRLWASEVRSYVRRSAIPLPEYPVQEPPRDHPLFTGGARSALDLHWLLSLSHDQYVAAFRGTSIKRAKCWMLRRNAAVALGNVADSESIPNLLSAVRQDEHPVVRGHAAWAIGRIATRMSDPTLVACLCDPGATESDPYVRQEIELAVGPSRLA